MTFHETSLGSRTFSVTPAAPRCTASSADVLYQHCLWSDGGLSIYSNQWRRDCNPVCFDDVNFQPVVALPRLGSYLRLIRGQTHVVDANTASFCNADVPFAIDHRETAETDVTVIGIDAALLNAVRPLPERADATLASGAASLPLSSRGALLHRLLIRELSSVSQRDDVAIFEAAMALLRCVLRAEDGRLLRVSSRIGRIAAERVITVRLLLARDYSEPLSLERIARVAGCSLWNLSREFSTIVGRPIHKYLVRLRLRHVLQEVLDGAEDLTAAALRAGFSSHSHMTAAFHREFGCTPSSLRGARGAAVLRELVAEFGGSGLPSEWRN